MKRMILIAASVLCLCPAAQAQHRSAPGGADAAQTDYAALMAEAEWDWHPGDLILRNGINDLDELIRDAEGAPWATVGILRASSGGPRVVYADQDQGVTEVMLYEFVDGLSGQDYEVYRVPSLDPNAPGKQMEQGPIAEFALLTAYGAAYDRQMLPDNGAYYSAELPYLAALKAGTALGTPVPLETLGEDAPALRNALLADWEKQPSCTAAASKGDCWDRIKGIAVITPAILMSSKAVTRVFPN